METNDNEERDKQLSIHPEQALHDLEGDPRVQEICGIMRHADKHAEQVIGKRGRSIDEANKERQSKLRELSPMAEAQRQCKNPALIDYWIPPVAKRCVKCGITYTKETPTRGKCDCGATVFIPVPIAPRDNSRTLEMTPDDIKAQEMIGTFKTLASIGEEKQVKWDQRGMELAYMVSKWSKDPSTQVGSALFNVNNTVAGVGYNGLPRGIEDSDERLTNRDLKYPMTIHAEENVMYNSTKSGIGFMRLYVTMHPCAPCAGKIIQWGAITEIICPTFIPDDKPADWVSSCKLAGVMFREAGIEVRIVD